jgi:hypothetical protein
LALLDDAVHPFADALHLLLEVLGFFLFGDGGLELRLEGFQFLLVAGAGGLDEEEQELGTVSGVLAFELQKGLVVEDGELDFFLQRLRLQFQLLLVARLVMRAVVGLEDLGVVLVVAHAGAGGTRLLIDLIMAMEI